VNVIGFVGFICASKKDCCSGDGRYNELCVCTCELPDFADECLMPSIVCWGERAIVAVSS